MKSTSLSSLRKKKSMGRSRIQRQIRRQTQRQTQRQIQRQRRPHTLSNSTTTKFDISYKAPTITTANEVKAILIRLKPSFVPFSLTPLTESELRNLYEMFPPEFIKRFTNKGFLTLLLFLKKTYESKQIFDICVDLFSIMYGTPLTSVEIAYIYEMLESSFILTDKKNENVVEIKGGMMSPYGFFILFVDLTLVYHVFLSKFYYKSLVLGVDECVSSLIQLVDKFDSDITLTTGKSMEHFYQKQKGTDHDPSKSVFGIAIDSTSWIIYTKTVRNTVGFRENQNNIIKYIELGVHNLNSKIDEFSINYIYEKNNFEEEEDVEYRQDTVVELRKINRATKLANGIVKNEAYAREKNKIYTEDSVVNLKTSILEVSEIEKDIQLRLKETASSKTKIVTNDDFQTLINYMDILFDKLKESKINLELRPVATECGFPVQTLENVKSSTDLLDFVSSKFTDHVEDVVVFINYALNTQSEIIANLSEDMYEYYTNVLNSVENINVFFKKVKAVVDIDIPTHVTMLRFLYYKLMTIYPLLSWYIYTFMLIVFRLSTKVCAYRNKTQKRIDNEEQPSNQLLLENVQHYAQKKRENKNKVNDDYDRFVRSTIAQGPNVSYHNKRNLSSLK